MINYVVSRKLYDGICLNINAKGDGNDVVWFCLMALVASEDCYFDGVDNGGGNEVDGNDEECNEDRFILLS